MKKAEPNEQLGISTLRFVFAHVAHLRRFMHPETKYQALYSHCFGGGSRTVLWGGYLGISRKSWDAGESGNGGGAWASQCSLSETKRNSIHYSVRKT